MKKVCLMLVLCATLMAGCRDKTTVVYEQAPVVPVQQVQPVVVQNNDPMVGVLAGMAIGSMMSNGMRYDVT